MGATSRCRLVFDVTQRTTRPPPRRFTSDPSTRPGCTGRARGHFSRYHLDHEENMNRFFATAAIALAAAVPAIAHAQTPASPVTLVLMGGAAMPMGDLDDIGDMGFTLGAGAEFGMSA